jgi:hypothetical protein
VYAAGTDTYCSRQLLCTPPLTLQWPGCRREPCRRGWRKCYPEEVCAPLRFVEGEGNLMRCIAGLLQINDTLLSRLNEYFVHRRRGCGLWLHWMVRHACGSLCLGCLRWTWTRLARMQPGGSTDRDRLITHVEGG